MNFFFQSVQYFVATPIQESKTVRVVYLRLCILLIRKHNQQQLDPRQGGELRCNYWFASICSTMAYLTEVLHRILDLYFEFNSFHRIQTFLKYNNISLITVYFFSFFMTNQKKKHSFNKIFLRDMLSSCS